MPLALVCSRCDCFLRVQEGQPTPDTWLRLVDLAHLQGVTLINVQTTDLCPSCKQDLSVFLGCNAPATPPKRKWIAVAVEPQPATPVEPPQEQIGRTD